LNCLGSHEAGQSEASKKGESPGYMTHDQHSTTQTDEMDAAPSPGRPSIDNSVKRNHCGVPVMEKPQISPVFARNRCGCSCFTRNRSCLRARRISFSEFPDSKQLKIAAAMHDITTGRVNWLF
jgi:hypothetical protein